LWIIFFLLSLNKVKKIGSNLRTFWQRHLCVIAGLPRPVSTCVFRIAMRFRVAYIGCLIQNKLFKIEIEFEKSMWKLYLATCFEEDFCTLNPDPREYKSGKSQLEVVSKKVQHTKWHSNNLWMQNCWLKKMFAKLRF